MNAISKLNAGLMSPEQLVDALGSIKAKVADLTAVEKTMKEALLASGRVEVEGEQFRATVTTSERNSLDMDAVRAKLSPQFITAHTTTTTTTSVRVVARTRK